MMKINEKKLVNEVLSKKWKQDLVSVCVWEPDGEMIDTGAIATKISVYKFQNNTNSCKDITRLISSLSSKIMCVIELRVNV